MDIKTKYDIGQTVYIIKSGKITSGKVGIIRMTVDDSYNQRSNKNELTIKTICTIGGVDYQEEYVYATQEDALRTMLPADDFDKVVKDISARTIDTWKNKK